MRASISGGLAAGLLAGLMTQQATSEILVGKSSRSSCHDLCHAAGYRCIDHNVGSFSCAVAAQNYCKNPYLREQTLLDPRTIECRVGGGCFVNCNENSFLEVARYNGTCGMNNCDIGEYSYLIMCMCEEIPTSPPEYEVTMSETETVGTLSLVVISLCAILWLLCCSCSSEIVKRSHSYPFVVLSLTPLFPLSLPPSLPFRPSSDRSAMLAQRRSSSRSWTMR
jgi:hypothetical protein